MHRLTLIPFLLIASLISTGCTSIRSVMLARNEHNTAWAQERHLPGVPITLSVPTHLKVAIKEKYYLTSVSAGGVTRVERVKLDVPVYRVDHEFINTEKIFTVDFKRPAAGTMDLTLDFKDDTQYFKQIQHEVKDETIKDVTALLDTLLPAGLGGVPAMEGADIPVREVESVVAVEIFEIDAPDFELQVAEFLRCHLNQAHDACVMPPGVEVLPRVGFHDDGHPGIQLHPEGECVEDLPSKQIQVKLPNSARPLAHPH